MNRFLAMLLSAGALFFCGCANDLTVEDTGNRGPAPFSPDPMQYVPQPSPGSPLSVGQRY